MNKKKVFIIITAILVALSSIVAIIGINLKNNKTIEVEAVVKLIGEDYIVVEDDKGEKYSLETNDEYSIGDRVDFLIKKIKNKSNPIEGTLVKIDTISKDISFSINDNASIQDEVNNDKDKIEEDISNNDNNSNNTSNKNTNNDVSSNITSTISNDNAVITYLTNLNNELEEYNQDKSIGKRLKEGFVTVVDFLFYDGEIKGHTFDELSNETKIKVLELALKIDSKIDRYFPGYKEEISTTTKDVYTNFKSKASALYLDITTKICDEDPDTCEAAKEGLRDLKESFSLTWDIIKNAGIKGLSKLKEWYEIWKTV